MSQTIAYLRTSMDKQDLGNQKLEILEWARKKDLKIDEFVQITMSSHKTRKQRRIEKCFRCWPTLIYSSSQSCLAWAAVR